MSAQPEIPFITDDEILRRIKQTENALEHARYAIGVIERELAAIRTKLEPRDAA